MPEKEKKTCIDEYCKITDEMMERSSEPLKDIKEIAQ
jgi:hypothetical protein